VARRERDEVREALERDALTIAQELRDGLLERDDLSHRCEEYAKSSDQSRLDVRAIALGRYISGFAEP
jgi:hypothetical protein